jgi:Ca2+-transporting ATPase
MFFVVSILSLGLQIFLVEMGGDFVRTSPLTMMQWLITIALGFVGVPYGIMTRLIPISEDPESFFTADSVIGSDCIDISDDKVESMIEEGSDKVTAHKLAE